MQYGVSLWDSSIDLFRVAEWCKIGTIETRKWTQKFIGDKLELQGLLEIKNDEDSFII